MTVLARHLAAILLIALAAGCAGDEGSATTGEDESSIVVTTNILGDVVSSIVGDGPTVTTIMPVGSNPHDFQASARDAAAIRSADLLVVNGGGFEQALADVVDGAAKDGVPVVEAVDFVEEVTGGGDPHFFTDPTRMSAVVEGIAAAVRKHVGGVDQEGVTASADDYVAKLQALDAEMESVLSAIPAEDRVLVTNHEVFGYFSERYEFEVVGVVVPSGSDGEGGSAQDLAGLVRVIREHDVRAIFIDASGSDSLAQTLAAEVGDIEVVELFSESLGEKGSGAATYIEMMRTNATRIAEALL